MGQRSECCADSQSPLPPASENRRGRGQNGGIGRRFCRRFRGGIAEGASAAPTETREQQLETLKRQFENLKTASDEISSRIQELEAGPKVESPMQ